jgi:hypothetical protein
MCVTTTWKMHWQENTGDVANTINVNGHPSIPQVYVLLQTFLFTKW